ncbi:hypothetical protein K6119_08045 [Paracrocinitomix mangrovi]|uniref:hypothetical protein n=1 Tax=Paracrocinitomix mangrovi TaxID=2862509 RepID=UPI001C8F1069|nr:hypothetical protein [Paracrocinitomix mangrovi]UKN03463.1 hypothetical protein K6119_08045 [Paracrocinitomix mangrovi]
MRQFIYNIFLVSILSSCYSESSENNVLEDYKHDNIDQLDSTEDHTEQILNILDSIDYSIQFIEKLKDIPAKTISLSDSLFIIDQTDTFIFPQNLNLEEDIVFTGKKDHVAIALSLKRINQTSLNYRFEMVEFGNSSYFQNGILTLTPNFYEENYLAEYNDITDSCSFRIFIGPDEETGSSLSCKLIKDCNDKLKNIEDQDFPVLLPK